MNGRRSKKRGEHAGSRPRVPIARREWMVVGFASATLAFVPWGLGGVVTPLLHLMFAGCMLTFLAAVVPLPARWNGLDNRHGNLTNLKRLLAFFPFWMCLSFLIYITLQGINPAWELRINEDRIWYMEQVEPPFPGLPEGTKSNYTPMNPFRVLVIFSAAFALLCGVWVGIQRRLSIQLVLWTFATSGMLMALMAILQRLTGATEVFWSIPSPNVNFWGSYFYRNQGAGFLNLILILCSMLFFYHASRTARKFQRSGPHMLLFAFCVVLMTSVAMSLSRGGFVSGGIVFLTFSGLALVRWLVDVFVGKTFIISLLVFAALIGGSYGITRYIDWRGLGERFAQAEAKLSDIDSDTRVIASRATLQMGKERWLTGWGAGSFRYMFPRWQQWYPEIYYRGWHKRKRVWYGRQVFLYAHNDIFQYFAEYGAIGCSFIVLLILSLLGLIAWFSVGNVLAALIVMVGVVAALGHALIEFTFQSPAYLIGFYLILGGTAKLLALDHARRRA